MENISDSLNSDLELLWQQVNQSVAVARTLAEQLRTQREVARKLEHRVAEQDTQLEQKQIRIDCLSDEIDQMHYAYHTIHHRISAAWNATLQLPQIVDTVELILTEYTLSKRENQELQNELDSLKILYNQLMDDYHNVKQQVYTLTTAVQECNALRERIVQIESDQLRSVALQEEVSYLRSANERLELLNSQRSQELDDALQKLAHYERECQHLRMSLETAESERATLHLKLIEHQAKLTELQEGITRSVDIKEHVSYSGSVAESLEQRERELARLHREYDSVVKELEGNKQEVRSLQQQLEDIMNKYRTTQKIADELKQRCAELEQELHQIRSLNEEVFEPYHGRIPRQIGMYNVEEADNQNHVDQPLRSLNAELEAATQECRQLQEQQQEQSQRIQQLQEALYSEIERNVRFIHRIQQLETQHRSSNMIPLNAILSRLDALVEQFQNEKSDNVAGNIRMVLDEVLAALRTEHDRNDAMIMIDDRLRADIQLACEILERYSRLNTPSS